jgi:hypothetical protein
MQLALCLKKTLAQGRKLGREAENPGTPRGQEFARPYIAIDLISFALPGRQRFFWLIN